MDTAFANEAWLNPYKPTDAAIDLGIVSVVGFLGVSSLRVTAKRFKEAAELLKEEPGAFDEGGSQNFNGLWDK